MDTLQATDPEEDTDVYEEEFEPVFDPILFREWERQCSNCGEWERRTDLDADALCKDCRGGEGPEAREAVAARAYR